MNQYSSFIFEDYSFDADEGRIELVYKLDDIHTFREVLHLPLGIDYQQINVELLERALFALHLIGGISYYKTYCPKEIIVSSGTLGPNQAAFWNTVYTKGLAEFFYKNDIDPTGLISFPAKGTDTVVKIPRPNPGHKALVPIGGGKDSLVSIDILKNHDQELSLMRLGSHPIIEKQVQEIGIPALVVERQLSPNLFELNSEDAYNGHVPITAYISFLNVVLALLYGFDAIAMSDERSASEGNTTKDGLEVNHQWSKGDEFEKLMISYIHGYITPSLDYFSFLRHLSELANVRYVTENLKDMLPLVTSCNSNWKLLKEPTAKRWCAECPKCAFAFSLFAAFLPREELDTMFENNLYDDQTLAILYRQLLGLDGIKPFECVGSPDEVQAAFLMAYNRGDLNNTPIMEMFARDVLPSIENHNALLNRVLNPSSNHHIPDRYLTSLHVDSLSQ